MERVRERLLRAASALENAGVPYAVVGGNAVAAWVAQVDEAAVRNTQDVDILLRREHLAAAEAALAPVGFVYRHVRKLDMFLDGPEAKARDALHVVFAGELVHPDSLQPAPDVSESVRLGKFQAVSLEALVEMKLSAHRLKDRVHLLDMLEVGLINDEWLQRLSPILADRLKSLIDNPDQ